MNQTEKRCDQLVKLDMSLHGAEMTYLGNTHKDFNIHWTEITLDTDEVWSKKINKMKSELDRRNGAE